MIYTDYESLEITQKSNICQKDFHGLLSKTLIHNIPNTPLNFRTTNFENDSFVVDWQLSEEENPGVVNCWY